MAKRVLSLIFAFLFIVAFASCEEDFAEAPETLAQETTATTYAEESAQSNPARDFTVYDKDGKEVKLSDLKGMPVVLNFWASWCPPCKSEMPTFNAIAKEYEGKVAFMMVNLTDGVSETQESAQSYIDSMGFTFPVYFDLMSEAAYTYGIQSIPTTFFIDADGNVVASYVGAMEARTLLTGIAMIYEEGK